MVLLIAPWWANAVIAERGKGRYRSSRDAITLPPTMELRQLTVFLAVAEHGSFTRAAEHLGTAQSAVSATVRRLEDELGAALLERTTHRVGLTDAGHALIPEARRTLAAADAAREAVDQVRGGLRGTVDLGTMQAQATGPVSTARFVAAFRGHHPGVQVRLRQAGSAVLADLVRDGHLDLAILGLRGRAPAGLELTALAQEPMMFACAPGHRLARRRTVELATVADEPGADLPAGWATRLNNDAAFTAAGLRRRLEYEVNDSASLVDLVRHGLAVAVMPRSLLPAGDESVLMIPLREHRHVHRVSLAVPTGRRLSRAAQALRDTILAAPPPA